jgi:hypothetical protein
MKLNLKREPRFTPRRPRLAAAFTTMLLLPDDREVNVLIRNISRDGFMAQSRAKLTEGTPFGVELPGRGIVRAEIRWCDGEEFGAHFERPLEIQEIDEI